MVGWTTAVYSWRDFWKQRPHVELIILDIAIYYVWPLQAAYAAYLLH